MNEYNETNEPIDYNDDPITRPADISPRNTAAKWALYGGLASIAIGLVLHLAGMTDYTKTGGGAFTQIFSYVIWIGTIVLAIREHRDELGGLISFKRAFSTGALTGVIYALITAVWTFLFFSFIAPEALDAIRDAQMVAMEERGMDDAQIEAASGMMGTFTSPGFISMTAFFMTALASLIISLIAGAIMKKD